jgi:hypothetical protein
MFGPKRHDPQRLRARLSEAEARLLRIETDSRDQAEKARQAAKASLRIGDQRGYHNAALRYATHRRKHEIASGLIKTIQGQREALTIAPEIDKALHLAEAAQDAEGALGGDDRLDRILAHIQEGLDTLTMAAFALTENLHAVSWGETTTKDLDNIHEEILAEIEKEATAGKRVKEELHRPPAQEKATRAPGPAAHPDD